MLRFLTMFLVAVTLAFGMVGCDIEQTEEGELPEVEVEGGNMPEYDVDTADVDIEAETEVITVPDVDIEPPDAGEPDEY